MNKTALTLALCLAATHALAQGRPQTTSMTCNAAKALVTAQGAIVLGTGRDLFDRYVRSQNFCAGGQQTLTGFVPTSDNSQCLIGYRCFDPPQETR